MAENDMPGFFSFMNVINEYVIANEDEASDMRLDQVRVQRDAERREKFGTLRAREHQGSRPITVRALYGYTDLS